MTSKNCLSSAGSISTSEFSSQLFSLCRSCLALCVRPALGTVRACHTFVVQCRIISCLASFSRAIENDDDPFLPKRMEWTCTDYHSFLPTRTSLGRRPWSPPPGITWTPRFCTAWLSHLQRSPALRFILRDTLQDAT